MHIGMFIAPALLVLALFWQLVGKPALERQEAEEAAAKAKRRENAALRARLDELSALRPKEGDPILWKRRGAQRPEPKVIARPDSPFAALAKLTEPPPRRKKPRRRKAVAAKAAS